MKRLQTIFLLLAFALMVFGQEKEMTVAERNAAQGFNDTIDRLDPDFVLVSLCIADPTDWHDDPLGVAGHAFLRLQCPTFGLDHCFSYEGENVNDDLFKYLRGETKMGMFRVETNDYLEDYRKWNRSVHEYRLNMPPEAEQRLWEIMDNHTTNKISLTQDLNKYGCAITAVKYVKRALRGVPIVYAPNAELEYMTPREIGYRSLTNHPWMRLIYLVFADNASGSDIPLDEKLIIPANLAAVWQQATVNGQPFAVYIGDIVEGAPLDNSKPWFTPIMLAILILLITIGMAFTRYPYWDWFLLGMQAIIGILLIVLWCIMPHFGGPAFILIALFNPLPAMGWYWHRYWALPYAGFLFVGIVILTFWPHMVIDPFFLVLALSYVVIGAKDDIKRFIVSRVTNHQSPINNHK